MPKPIDKLMLTTSDMITLSLVILINTIPMTINRCKEQCLILCDPQYYNLRKYTNTNSAQQMANKKKVIHQEKQHRKYMP